jgi:protein TonB
LKHIFFIFIFCSPRFLAQNETKVEVYTITEESASFPGGIPQMMEYMKTNTKYPQKCRMLLVGGKAFLKFVVNEDGTIINVEVLKSAGMEDLDQEAVRVVKSMPIWTPAKMKGKPVKCYFNLPFNFAITETPFFIFNVNNQNTDYSGGNIFVVNRDYKAALGRYSKSGDLDSQYNMGVIYYLKKKNKKARKCFTNIKNSINDNKQSMYVLCEKYLNTYLN